MECKDCPQLWTCAMVCFEVECNNKTSKQKEQNNMANNNTNTTASSNAQNNAAVSKTTTTKAKELATKVKDVALKHVNGAKDWAKAHPKHAAGFGVVLGALLLWKLKGSSNKKGGNSKANSK